MQPKGDFIYFVCTFKVRWFHENTELEESARTSIEANEDWSFLKMKNLNSKDGGQYRVMAENVAGLAEAKFQVYIKGMGRNLCLMTLKHFL